MEDSNSLGTAFSDYYARTKEEDDREVIDAEREKQGQNIRLGSGDALVSPDEDTTPPPPLRLDEHSIAPQPGEEEGEGEPVAPVGGALGKAASQAAESVAGMTMLGSVAPSLRSTMTDVVAQATIGAASDVIGMAAGVGAGLASLPFDIAEVAKAAPKDATVSDIVKEAADRSYEWGKGYREAVDYPAARTGPGEIARFMGTFLMVDGIVSGVLTKAMPLLGAGADLGGFAGAGARAYAKQIPLRVYNSPAAKRMLAGAIADAVVSSEYANFSAILHENGIDNAVVNALRYEPEDPKIERMFKSAVEGMLIPAVLRGAFKTAKGTFGVGKVAVTGGKQELLKSFNQVVALARDFNKAPAAVREEATAMAAQVQQAARASTGEPSTVGVQPPLETAAVANGTVVEDAAKEATGPTTVLGKAMTPETTAEGTTATGAFVKTAVNMKLRKAAEQAWAEGKWSSGDVIFRSWSREFHNRVAEAFAEAGNPLTKSELRFIRKLYDANALRWANEAGAPAELYFGYRFGQLGAGGGRKGARKSVQDAIRVIVEQDVKKAAAQVEKKGGTALMQEGEQAVGKGAGKPVTVKLPSVLGESEFFTGGRTSDPTATRSIDQIIGYHGTNRVGMIAEALSSRLGFPAGKMGNAAAYTGPKVLGSSYGGDGAIIGAKILYRLGIKTSKKEMLKLGEMVLDTTHVLDDAIDPRHERVADILLEAAEAVSQVRRVVWNDLIPKTHFDEYYRPNPAAPQKPKVGVVGETVDAYGSNAVDTAADNPELLAAMKNIEGGTFEDVYLGSFMDSFVNDLRKLDYDSTPEGLKAIEIYRDFINEKIYRPLREIDYEMLVNPHAEGMQPAVILLDPNDFLKVGRKLDVTMTPVATPRAAVPGRFGLNVATNERMILGDPKEVLSILSEYRLMGRDTLLLGDLDTIDGALRLAETAKASVDEVVRASDETMTTPMRGSEYSPKSATPGVGYVPIPGVGLNRDGIPVVSSVQPVTFAHNVSLEEQYDALRAVAATTGSRTGARETRALLVTDLPAKDGDEVLGMFEFARDKDAREALDILQNLGIYDAHIMGDNVLYVIKTQGDAAASEKFDKFTQWARDQEITAPKDSILDLSPGAEFDFKWATLYTPEGGKAGAIANGQYQGIIDEFAAKYPESDKSGLRARLGLNIPRESPVRQVPRDMGPGGVAEGVGRDGRTAAGGEWVPEGEPGFRPDVAEPGVAVSPALVKQRLSTESTAANAIAAMTNSANPNDFARFYQSAKFDRYLSKVKQVVAETYGDVNLLRVKTDPNSSVGMFMRASTRADAQGVEYFVRADEVLGVYPNGDLIFNSIDSGRVPAAEGLEAATEKLFVGPAGAFYQTGEEAGAKGMISFLDDARVVISLVKGKADYTTFIHESAHLFLRDLDIMPDAPVEELYKWAGVASGTDYKNWPVEAQEKWARAFERFCTEGKLPDGASGSLKRLFNQQKESMREVYGKIIGTEIDVDMDPKVAEFMGKIIAGDTSGLSGGIGRAAARFGTTFDRDAEGNVFINFDRIYNADDIRGMMQEFANLDKQIVARMLEGTSSHDEIRAGAKRLNMSVSEALGLPPNMTETEALAVRDLEVAAARTVQDYAARARMSKSAEDLLAFRRSITVYRALGAQVRAQGKFAGRLLESRKIMARDAKQQLEAIEQVIQTEGTEDILNLANMIEILDNPEKVAAFVKNLDKATAGDVLHEMFINNVLSSTLTFAANVLGNTTTLAMSLAHTASGAFTSKVFGDGTEVHFREVQESMYGLMRGVSEAWSFAKDAFRDDYVGVNKFEESMTRSKHRRSIVSSTFGVNENSYLGQAIDAIGAAWRTPTRGLRATDRFYNTIAYRMELHRLAYRDAVDTFVKSGKKMTQDEVGMHMAKFLADPPVDVMKRAKKFAEKNTFVDEFEGQFARNISRLSSVKGARNFFPFMHTPMKIFQYSLENTPFAPLSAEFRRKLMSSDANEAAIARGQYGVAVAAFLAIGDLYDRKMVVGSYDTSNPGAAQSQRRTGILPCAFVIGDKTVQVSRIEPLGSSICMMIDVWSAMDKMEMADTGQLAAGTLLHLMDAWQDKAFLRTYGDLMKGLNDGRPDIVEGILGNLVTGHVVPMSGFVGQVERMASPSDKDVAVSSQDPGLAWINRMLNETTSHIPFLSERLPDKANLWGETQSRLNGLDDRWFNRVYAGVSPINIGQSQADDLAKYDAILQATGEYPLMPERKIGDYELSPKQYREYVVRSGTLARNYLKRIWPSVSKLGSMEDQADVIRKVIENSRKQAKAEFASKLPVLDRVRAIKKDTSKGVEERRVWGMTLEQVKGLEVPTGTTPVPSR